MRRVSPSWFTLAALLASGCGTQSLPGPALSAVCLKDDSTSCIGWAYAGEPLELIVLGRHFHAPAEIDLDSRENPPLDDRFEAFLGGVAIEGLEPGPGLIDDQQVLTGRLPGNLPAASHDLELDAPTGQQARLEDAFVVRTPLRVGLTRDEPQLPTGSVVRVLARFENLAGVPLTDVTARFTQEGSGRLQPPAPLEPFTLDAERDLSVALTTRADTTGAVRLSLEATANAGGRIPVENDAPAEVDLLILAPAELSATLQLEPATVASGDPLVLVVQVYNQGGTPALQVRLLPPVLHGSGTVVLQGPAPEIARVPAGQSRNLRWYAEAGAPGSVELEVELTAVEAISGRRLGPVDAGSVLLEIE